MKLIYVSIVLMSSLVGCSQTIPSSTVDRHPSPTVEQQLPSELSLNYLMKRSYDGRDLAVGQILDQNSSYTRYYITYKSADLKISGIMNVPTGTGPFPILILNHGYIDPAIYTNGRGLKREQDYFARRGYIVIHSDYRNHADSDKDEQAEYRFRLGYTEDVINVIMAVKASALPFFNKNNIGLLGHSMGGGITENILVVQPDLVQAAVLYAPVSANVVDNFNRWTKTRPEVANTIIADHGEPEANPEFYAQLSPINYLDRITAPIMLHHGTSDQDVPIAWSDTLNQALSEENKAITYHVYPGQPHEFTTQWPLMMQRSVDFFDQYLKKK